MSAIAPGSQTRSARRIVGLVARSAALLVGATVSLAAQPPTAIVLRDDRGRAVIGARVAIAGDSVSVRTDVRGVARVRAPDAGPWRLTVRAVGFSPLDTTVDAPLGRGAGEPMTLTLTRLPQAITAVTTRATRTGIAGQVVDARQVGQPFASVRVVASGVAQRTDSSGAFVLPLRPGVYLLEVAIDNREPRLVPVRVPADSLVTVTIPLVRASLDAAAAVRARNRFDLQQRMVRATAVRYRLIPHAELAATGATDLSMAVARVVGMPLGNAACVLLDGGPVQRPLAALDVDDVVFVEVLLPGARRGRGGADAPGCPVVAWMDP